jgi:hypothetical protein
MALRKCALAAIGIASAGVFLAACSASGDVSTTAVTTSSPASISGPSNTASAPSSPTPKAKAKPGKYNSCLIVTAAEAGSALGSTVSTGELGSATVEGGLACVFYGPSAPAAHNPNSAQPDTVRVVLVKGANALKWFNDYKSKVPFRTVHGFGDKAYFDGGASLSILKGSNYLRIAVVPAAGPPSLADEKKLATAVLPNI